MEKRLSFHGVLMTCVVVLAVFLSSCSKSAYKKAIPADAPVVFELDVKDVGMKSEFASQRNDVADLVEAIDPDDKDLQKIADALRNPEDMGLDFLNPMYLFMDNALEEVFFLASVRDEDALIAKLESFRNFEVDKDGDLGWVLLNGRNMGVLTSKVLLLGSQSDKQIYRELLKNDKSFFDIPEGKYFEKHTGDLTACLNAKSLSRKAQRDIRREVEREVRELRDVMNDEIWERLFETEVVVNLECKAGEIALNLFCDAEEDKDDIDVLNVKVSKDVLKMVPNRDLLALVALGIDGPEICEQVDKAMDKSDISFNSQEKMVYNMFKQILRKTDGTAAVALFGRNFDDDPDFLGILPTPYEEVEPMLEIFGDEIPRSIAIDGDKKSISATNIRNYSHGEVKPSFEKASRATSAYVYAFVEAEPLVEAAFDDMTRRTIPEEVRFLNALRALADLADFAELKVETKDAAQLLLVLNNDSKNALAFLLSHGIKIGNAYIEYENARSASYREYYDEIYDLHDDLYEEEDAVSSATVIAE